MYDSPQVDMGYDISHYEDVYRPYGTIQDMETLIAETHARGMYIMLDLVINHTFDQHAWFKESSSSKDNPKRDWYIWRPAKYSPTGKRLPPKNWRCCFGGGSAWEWDEHTEEYYLHVWATEQPDLNWDTLETRKAIYASAMEFWLNRGVDSFAWTLSTCIVSRRICQTHPSPTPRLLINPPYRCIATAPEYSSFWGR